MKTLFNFLFLLMIVSCSVEKHANQSEAKNQKITVANWGSLSDGRTVKIYTLRNSNGVSMQIINYGGIVVSLNVPGKNGIADDVVLGFDSLSQYVNSNPYFGAIVGRYSNRIAHGKFVLDGTAHKLVQNNGENHLHGGLKGFDKVFWDITVRPDSTSLLLSYSSRDGEEGYPGNLSVEVIYTLNDSNEFKIDYRATTDKNTIVNLTQHSYFNLAGKKSANILDHTLQVHADAFLPVDETLIPTGEIKDVTNTPFDFKQAHRIGERIDNKDGQLIYGNGYDHCWVLNDYNGSLRKVASLADQRSGRSMEVWTTEPGMQFYSGNFLDGSLTGKSKTKYNFRSGLCLETQHFPDSPNKPQFPSVVLNADSVYQSTTMYKFYWQ